MNLGGVVCIFQAVGSDYRVNKKIKDKDEVQGPLSLRPLNTGVAGYMRGGPGALLRTLLPHAQSVGGRCLTSTQAVFTAGLFLWKPLLATVSFVVCGLGMLGALTPLSPTSGGSYL